MKITKQDLIDMNCDPEHIDDWFAIRAAKKKPLTSTAVKRMQTEAEKAGLTLAQAVQKCAEEGWLGFKAEYMPKPSFNAFNGSGFVSEPKTNKQAVRESLRNINGTDW